MGAQGSGREQGFMSMRLSVPSNETRYLSFLTEGKEGVLFVGGASNKRSIYLFGSTSSGNVNLVPAFEPASMSITVSASGNVITLANGSTAARILVLMSYGALPSVQTTLPA